MRKHKSVVAILLAVMMIFTFMPTMAFASIPSDVPTEGYKFSDDLSKIVKVEGTTETDVVGTVKVWDENGRITVSADTSQIGDLPAAVQQMKFVYVDLTDSTFLVNGNPIAASYNNDLGNTNVVTGLRLKKPSYAKAVATTTPDTIDVAFADLSNYVNSYETGSDAWTCAVKLNGKDAAIKATAEEQTVEVTLKQTWLKSNNHRVTGAPAAATTKVNATNGDFTKAEFYFDKVDKDKAAFSDGLHTIDYDGAEHSVVMATLKGYTVKYTVFNSTTGNWDKVDTVTVKEPGSDNDKRVAAEIYDSKDVKKTTYNFTVGTRATAYAQVGFDKDGDLGEYTYRVEPGTLFDPAEFLTVEAIGYTIDAHYEGTFPYGRWVQAVNHTVTDADKAAVEANKAEILAAFKDYYDIEQKSTKANPNTVTLTIKAKKLSSDEETALNKKYENLFNRFYDLSANTTQTGTVKFQKYPAVNDKEDDISFEGQTTYVFSGKKTTKKGVLKKAQTIAVSATADSGNEITYVATKSAGGKIVVSKTGTITVKKGLKKGTYKVAVKAKTAAGNGFKAAKEKQTYTIKIKK
jgi:hypothetical protein